MKKRFPLKNRRRYLVDLFRRFFGVDDFFTDPADAGYGRRNSELKIFAEKLLF